MKLKQIILATPALTKLGSQELELTAAYKLSRLLNSLQPDLEFHNEKKNFIAEKYGTLNKEKTVFTIPPDKAKEATEELEKLMDIESQVEIIPLNIPLSSGITISAHDIQALEGIIEFTEE